MTGASRSRGRAWTWDPPGGERVDLGLRVRSLGDGPRTVLLLHGLAGSNRYFGAAFDTLGQHARLLVPDLLGFGHSPRPEDARYDARAHADAVIDVLERLDVRQDLWVAGHSAGALVALELASRLPDAVRRVWAVSPPLYRDPAQARSHISKLGLYVRLFAMGGRLAQLTCRWMCRHRELAASLFAWFRPDLPEPVARDGTLHSWTSYSRTMNELILGGTVAHRVGSIRAPVELIVGEDDPVPDRLLLSELACQAPHITLESWPGGHDLPLRDPERLVRRIVDAIGA